MRENYRKVPKPGAPVCIAGAIASVSLSAAALAQEAEPPIGIGTLPRDLSPWGMYLNADPVVKAVLIGLAHLVFRVGADEREIFFGTQGCGGHGQGHNGQYRADNLQHVRSSRWQPQLDGTLVDVARTANN